MHDAKLRWIELSLLLLSAKPRIVNKPKKQHIIEKDLHPVGTAIFFRQKQD